MERLASENNVMAFTNILLRECVGNRKLLTFEEIAELSEKFIKTIK